jgi:hypothetical protein
MDAVQQSKSIVTQASQMIDPSTHDLVTSLRTAIGIT